MSKIIFDLKKSSSYDLTHHLKTLVQQERELLHHIILTVKEIDLRKLYLKMGFSSLFDYLVKHIGYSEGAAQRRIDAARLLLDVPLLAAKIESGEIKLNQVSLIQRTVRQIVQQSARGESPIKVTAIQKQELVDLLSDKNHRESQTAVATYFHLPVLQQTVQKSQADESVRLEMTFTKEQFAKLQRAKELLSHAVPTGDLVDLIEYLSDKVIQQKMTSSKRQSAAMMATTAQTTATAAVKPRTKMAIPTAVRKQLFKKQDCCQYTDAKTKNKCGSRWQLQIDHIRPQWADGDHKPENLQVLCAAHNRLRYREQAGIRAV